MEGTYEENGLGIQNCSEAWQEQKCSQIALPLEVLKRRHVEEVVQVVHHETREETLNYPCNQLNFHELSVSSVDGRCAEVAAKHEKTMVVFSKVCEKIIPGMDSCPVPEDDASADCSDESEPEFRFNESSIEIHNEFPADYVGNADSNEWTTCSEEESADEIKYQGATEHLGIYTLNSAGKFATEPTDAHEVFRKEKRHGRRRGNKKTARRLSHALLTAILDAVDATLGGRATVGNSSRADSCVSSLFSPSRRSGASKRATNAQETYDASENDMWSTKRLSSIVATIETRLEHLAQFVLAAPDTDEVPEQLRAQLSEIEKRIVELLPVVGGPGLQARLEMMARRVLRLRGAPAGPFTDLDVQMVIKDARRHLKAAQGAASKLVSGC